MPRELYPPSYECDCGHQSHFFEQTIKEAKVKSQAKRVRLGDSSEDEHYIVFFKGEMVEVVCPQNSTAQLA